ncbi:MAG: hypothetical protein KGJ35_03210 [Patescibacteria group bacterium]|nr:hypothetical protein [Patescibacteria group bacterium]
MYILITIFYLSLAIIVFMLWSKRTELATGKQSLVSRLGQNSDHVFHRLHADFMEVVSYFNKHTFIAFTQWIAAHVLLWLRTLYIKIFHLAHRNPHTKKVIDMVRGEIEINTQGGASFFLKKIAPDTNPYSTKPIEK